MPESVTIQYDILTCSCVFTLEAKITPSSLTLYTTKLENLMHLFL